MPPELRASRRSTAPLWRFGLLRDDRDYVERAGFEPRRPTPLRHSCFALRISVRFAKLFDREIAIRRFVGFGAFARKHGPALAPYSS